MNIDYSQIIQEVLSEILGRSISGDERSISLRDLGVDSLGMVELVLGLQKRLEFQISDEDVTVKNFGTVEKLDDYLRQRLGA